MAPHKLLGQLVRVPQRLAKGKTKALDTLIPVLLEVVQ